MEPETGKCVHRFTEAGVDDFLLATHRGELLDQHSSSHNEHVTLSSTRGRTAEREKKRFQHQIRRKQKGKVDEEETRVLPSSGQIMCQSEEIKTLFMIKDIRKRKKKRDQSRSHF